MPFELFATHQMCLINLVERGGVLTGVYPAGGLSRIQIRHRDINPLPGKIAWQRLFAAAEAETPSAGMQEPVLVDGL